MESLIQVKQLSSSVMSFLLIPSAFVLAVYIGKLIDGLKSNPSVFHVESVIGIILSLLLALYAFKEQNNSSFVIQGIGAGEDYAHSISLTNMSGKTVDVEIEIFAHNEKKKFSQSIEKYSHLDLSQSIIQHVKQDNLSQMSIRLNVTSKPSDLVVKAFSYEKRSQKITDVSPENN